MVRHHSEQLAKRQMQKHFQKNSLSWEINLKKSTYLNVNLDILLISYDGKIHQQVKISSLYEGRLKW